MEVFDAVGFTIFDIPGYFFFAGVGFVAMVSVFIILVSEKKYSLPKNLFTLVVASIFAVIFARLFGCISGMYKDLGIGKQIGIEDIKQTGIVYYGGLIGFIMSYSFIRKLFHEDRYILDVLATCIPLFHAISRIGCFTGGCCYGVESKSCFAIRYKTRVFNDIVTVNRIPIQLIEATINFIMFLYLFHLIKNENWKRKHILRQYLAIYSIVRFFIEFFRGDSARGVVCGISFSQIISVIIWIYLLIIILNGHNKKE